METSRITSTMEGCFQWTIWNFRDTPRNFCRRSPCFFYLDTEYQLSVERKSGLDGMILISIFSPSRLRLRNLYVEVQIHTEDDIASEIHNIFTLSNAHYKVHCLVNFGNFVSSSNGQLLHDRLSIDLQLRKIQIVSSDEELDLNNKLQEDFESLLASGDNSDITLLVGKQEFPAHRSILFARVPEFKSMFNAFSSNNRTLNIGNYDPDGFADFLKYVYTGNVEYINTGNVLSLYTISNDYLFDELKEKCVSFLMANMSVEQLWDIVKLVSFYEDKKLIQVSQNFFLRNTREIIKSEIWLSLLQEYPTMTSEIFIQLLLRSGQSMAIEA